MSQPLLSIIIPTHGRPRYLATALDSALSEAGNVEVVVVPNGPDTSWQPVLAKHASDDRVRVHPIGTLHGNAARNHGMSVARGRYLRFLDDDDVLYPEGAKAQLAMIEQTGADIVSASIDLLREDGACFRTVPQPDTDDFVSAVMCEDRLLQVTAHVFRADWVRSTPWNPSLPYAQDMDWMFRLCQGREPSWRKVDCVSGGWRRHTGRRTTTGAKLDHAKRLAAEGILQLVEVLRMQGRLDDTRRAAAASGLWGCVHSALFMSPRYWSAIAKTAEALCPGSHPGTRFFRSSLARSSGLTPLQWEQILAPKRLVTYVIHRALLSLRIARSW